MKHIHDEYTQDMFGRPLTGLELGHAMAKVAADHAGNEWKNLAYESFVEYAKHHREFTTEQARGACLHVPPPPDKRAWGFLIAGAIIFPIAWIHGTGIWLGIF